MKNILCCLGIHKYAVTGVTTAATYHPKHNAVYAYYCKCQRKNCGKAKEVISKVLKTEKPKHNNN